MSVEGEQPLGHRSGGVYLQKEHEYVKAPGGEKGVAPERTWGSLSGKEGAGAEAMVRLGMIC